MLLSSFLTMFSAFDCYLAFLTFTGLSLLLSLNTYSFSSYGLPIRYLAISFSSSFLLVSWRLGLFWSSTFLRGLVLLENCPELSDMFGSWYDSNKWQNWPKGDLDSQWTYLYRSTFVQKELIQHMNSTKHLSIQRVTFRAVNQYFDTERIFFLHKQSLICWFHVSTLHSFGL